MAGKQAFTRRAVIGGMAASLVSVPILGRTSGADSNPIVTENLRPGTTAWRVRNGSKYPGELTAYSRQTSVSPGERLEVAVNVSSARSVSASVYRLGWYQGTGGRLMKDLGSTNVGVQAASSPESQYGLYEAGWATAFSFVIAADWLSGVYVVRVTDSGGHDFAAIFVIKDQRSASFMYQQPITTYSAYNGTPYDGTGKSLYDFRSAGSVVAASGSARAVKVSFDRPNDGGGTGDFLRYEVDLVQFLEREGYDVSYATVIDTHDDPSRLLRYKGVLSAGHDEYWSQEVTDAFNAARDRGVHLAFFGANAAYWRVRFEKSSDGRSNRTVTAYKEAAGSDPGAPTTAKYRDVGQPEQRLIGVQYIANDNTNQPFVPQNTSHWFWRGTGAVSKQALPVAIVGYEIDSRQASYASPTATSYTTLGASPFPAFGNSYVAESSIYTAPSGAIVWASGTMSWAWGLNRSGYKHPAIEQATRNLLAAMLGGPPPTTSTTTLSTLPITSTTAAVTSTTAVATTTTTVSTTLSSSTTAATTTTRPTTTTTAPAPAGPTTSLASSGPFAPFASATAFVNQQYVDFLGRKGDAGGVSYWVGIAGPDGAHMTDVVNWFLKSEEFSPRFAVARLYQTAFGRIPDAAGYDYWNKLAAVDRVALRDIAYIFTSGAELSQTYGDLTNRDFVNVLYVNVFQRRADPGGLQFWTDWLTAGGARFDLLVYLSQSAEFELTQGDRVFVIASYQGLLRRPPTASEVEVGMSLIKSQGTDKYLRGLMNSSEYGSRFG